MNQIKTFFSAFRYELAVFSTLSMNFLLFFTKEQIMSDSFYPIHIADTEFGLISRTFVGTVTGFLWEHPTKAQVAFFHFLIVFFTFVLSAVFLGKCIKKSDEKCRTPLFLLCLVIAIFPYGFSSYINLFELLDIYWVLCIVLCLFCAENKITVFFIPALIFLGEWVHFSFVLAFMPLIYILCFSKCIKEKRLSCYVLTGIMIAASVSATLYFSYTSHSLRVSDFSEFSDYIISKAGDKITDFETYCGEIFRSADEFPFELYEKNSGFPEWVKYEPSLIKKLIYSYFFFTFIDGSVSRLIADYILASPLIAFFVLIWKKTYKEAKEKKEKFIYFLCLITPLVGIAATLLSSDTSRWLSLMIIQNLFMLAIFLKENASPVNDAFFYITEKLNKHKAPLLFALCFYLSIVFVW